MAVGFGLDHRNRDRCAEPEAVGRLRIVSNRNE